MLAKATTSSLMATPEVREAFRLFELWYATLKMENPGMNRVGNASALFVEFENRTDELSCLATWYEQFCEKNPGMTIKGIAFALFLEKMKNEPLQPMEKLEALILQMRNAFEHRFIENG